METFYRLEDDQGVGLFHSQAAIDLCMNDREFGLAYQELDRNHPTGDQDGMRYTDEHKFYFTEAGYQKYKRHIDVIAGWFNLITVFEDDLCYIVRGKSGEQIAARLYKDVCPEEQIELFA